MRLRSLLVGLTLALPAAAGAQTVTFAGTVTSFAPSPTLFSFTFATPVTLGSFTGVALDFAATLGIQTALSGSVTPGGPGGYVLSAYGSLGGGVPVLLGQYGSETCSTSSFTACAYSPAGGATFWFGSAMMLDWLEAEITYTSTTGMEYHFEGHAVLSTTPPPTAVPEPATVLLLGTGLLVIGGVAVRRRSRG